MSDILHDLADTLKHTLTQQLSRNRPPQLLRQLKAGVCMVLEGITGVA